MRPGMRLRDSWRLGGAEGSCVETCSETPVIRRQHAKQPHSNNSTRQFLQPQVVFFLPGINPQTLDLHVFPNYH